VRVIVQALPALQLVREHLVDRLGRSCARVGRAAWRRLWSVLRVLATTVYARQRWYVVVKQLDAPDAFEETPGQRATECLVLDSPKALRAVAPEIRAAFRHSVAELHAHLARGCIVCVARQPRGDGAGTEVVGYEIVERGVFAALGRRTPLARDIVFSHGAEVLPAYRGQRLHRRLCATRDAYFRRRAGRLLCGVIPVEDAASTQAARRTGHRVVGTVTRISVLKLVTVWRTPVERIERALGRGSDRRVTAASRGAA
jgi:hypothetical protein